MAARVSTLIAERIKTAVEELQAPQMIKDRLEWEIVPGLKPTPDGGMSLIFMVGLGLPVPGTEDRIMPFAMLEDDKQGEVTRIVRSLYDRAQGELDAAAGIPAGQSRKSAGGLLIP